MFFWVLVFFGRFFGFPFFSFLEGKQCFLGFQRSKWKLKKSGPIGFSGYIMVSNICFGAV